MTTRHPNRQRILDFNLDRHSEETLKRLCVEVPCQVNLSHCNVVTWFERQVQRKVKTSNSDKWRVYRDQKTLHSFLKRRGAFLFEKYLSGIVAHLQEYNRKLLRYIVWVEFMRKDRPEETDSELSINTIFDTSSLMGRSQSLPLSQHSDLSITTPASLQFDYDLDGVITSTQRSEESYVGDS